jgi:hypothetical protein
VGAAGGECPAEDARFGLFDFPPRGLLRAMMGAAFGAEVALVGGAVGVGRRVVEVGVGGVGLAAGAVQVAVRARTRWASLRLGV